MSTTTQAGQTIEFGNGSKIVIPRPDLTLRTDLWVSIFDGTYRLFLDLARASELERVCGYIDREGDKRPLGLMAIYGSVAKGRYELEGRSVGFGVEAVASVDHCRETIRLALIGGGHAMVDGENVRIDASRARELIETYILPAPAEDSWNLAYLILHTAMHGRKQRPEEVGTLSSRAVPPAEPEIDAES